MYHCTIDLLYHCFGISCMTTDGFCFYLQNRLIQTSQTGGQRCSDTSPFSTPWFRRSRTYKIYYINYPFIWLAYNFCLIKYALKCMVYRVEVQQPGVMFLGKARAHPSKAPFRYSTLWQAPGLTHKHQNRLERLTGDNRSGLL